MKAPDPWDTSAIVRAHLCICRLGDDQRQKQTPLGYPMLAFTQRSARYHTDLFPLCSKEPDLSPTSSKSLKP